MMWSEIIEQSVKQAKQWVQKANALQTETEKCHRQDMHQLIADPNSKTFLITLLDRGFRLSKNKDLFQLFSALIHQYGIPQFLSGFEQFLIKLTLLCGVYFSIFSMPLMKYYIRKHVSHVVLPAHPKTLRKHLKQRYQNGFKVNLNRVGEMVLSEADAEQFMTIYKADILNPDIHCLSVKCSSLCSKLHFLAEDRAEVILKKRLAELLRLSETHHTLLTLDMEEFKDLDLAMTVFKDLMDMYPNLQAGIVIQAYLKQSEAIYLNLLKWAKVRRENKGKAIRIRLVKGANLSMESILASQKQWENPVFSSKLEVDANFKKLLSVALKHEHTLCIHVGVASHNVFDLAFAYQVSKYYKSLNYLCFELLEGVANPIVRALKTSHDNIMLYTPVAAPDQFMNAIAYLIRRFDENTAPNHFLRYFPTLTPRSEQWIELRTQFLKSLKLISQLDLNSNFQNRLNESYVKNTQVAFQNEPDTDLRFSVNRNWAERICEKWMFNQTQTHHHLTVFSDHKQRQSKPFFDRSLSHQPLLFTVDLALEDDVETLISTLTSTQSDWSSFPLAHRQNCLAEAAINIRKKRGDFIGMMAATLGKPFTESDAEVSEAVDFTEFYPRSLADLENESGMKSEPKGNGLVISPWNFPLAIPCGGIVASLVGGNVTVLKPAPEAMPIAIELAECFWQAGVPRDALYVLPLENGNLLEQLSHADCFDFLIFTGSTATAKYLSRINPKRPLFAETGGKNATIISRYADIDLAIQNCLHSAFSNAGQKCSATSVLLLEECLYNSASFKETFKNAVLNFDYGSPWKLSNKMGYLVQKPTNDRLKALHSLEEGETWLVEPQEKKRISHLYSPAVKWGVKPGSLTQQTELFMPLLSVIAYRTLAEAVDIANSTPYGLTAGLESLNEAEQTYWKTHIQAGNLYINRPTTGAIVQRQPFGGIKQSSFGSGLKAGSEFYVSAFVNWQAPKDPPTLNSVIQKSKWLSTQLFSRETPNQIVKGELNQRFFKPPMCVGIRIKHTTSMIAVQLLLQYFVNAELTFYLSLSQSSLIIPEWIKTYEKGEIAYEPLNYFLKKIPLFSHLRYIDSSIITDEEYQLALENHIAIESGSVLSDPKLELIRYFQEYSLSQTNHRYGFQPKG